jgi:hypothetical protein
MFAEGERLDVYRSALDVCKKLEISGAATTTGSGVSRLL